MKKVLCGLSLVLAFALPALAQDKEQDRVENAGKVMKEFLNAPDSIPQSVLDKADCVVVLPSVLKFAIGIGGSYGRGVMTCRGGKSFKGHWGAPTMMALEGGSFGLQLGGQATDFVLLLMNSRAASSILSSKVKLGGDVSAAAGPVGRTASAETDGHKCGRDSLFSRARDCSPNLSGWLHTACNNGANQNLYGKEVSAKAIVFNHAVPTPPSAKLLIATLTKGSPVNKSAN